MPKVWTPFLTWSTSTFMTKWSATSSRMTESGAPPSTHASTGTGWAASPSPSPQFTSTPRSKASSQCSLRRTFSATNCQRVSRVIRKRGTEPRCWASSSPWSRPSNRRSRWRRGWETKMFFAYFTQCRQEVATCNQRRTFTIDWECVCKQFT